ncbi:DNA invertase Pin-like site-specific DNA recombinase [Prauserella rugosa]|uniref:DNA invertase Pin-like site-specific DNA recombinase n=2 Tax=Prauserella rugosa TaxID=43354 RepID=A0A660CGZ2_9PSEU|nr:DNA invertase Pin-like site-specific DNA recombinase [Prauserella rugosa]
MTEATTSPERQREIITRWAAFRQDEIIGWAEDLDVSATTYGPMARPELGDWLQRRSDEFDAVVFWKLDRAVRSASDLSELIRWAKDNRKGLVFAEDALDLDTPTGEAMAYISAVFAHLESVRISERVTSAQSYLRSTNRRASGYAPYGYRTVDNPDGRGRVLAVDPDTSAIVRQMVARAIEGASMGAIARELNAQGVAPPRGATAKDGTPRYWGREVVAGILRSPAILGQKIHKGRPVRGDDGLPLVVAPPLIDHDTHQQLKAAIAARAGSRRRTHEGDPLVGVVECWHCGRPAYRHAATRRLASGPKTYVTYRCKPRTDGPPNCGGSVDEDTVKSLLEWQFLDVAGGLERKIRRFIPGEDHTAELERVKASITDLRTARYQRAEFTTADDVAEYDRMMEALLAERERLSELPQRPSGWVLEPAGETYAEAWQRSDWAQRAQLVSDAGLRLRVGSEPRSNVLYASMVSMDTQAALRTSEQRWNRDRDERVSR